MSFLANSAVLCMMDPVQGLYSGHCVAFQVDPFKFMVTVDLLVLPCLIPYVLKEIDIHESN